MTTMQSWKIACCLMLLSACAGNGGRSQGGGPSAGTASYAGAGLGPGSSPVNLGAGGMLSASAGKPAANAANSTASMTACNVPGATRSCCTGGTQTCSGSTEFAFWGPCLNPKGTTLTCNSCGGTGEFGSTCDAGVPLDSGSKCGAGEFGPNCDAGMPALCTDEEISNEPEILAAFAPASGKSVSANGQIKVWINDERAAIIAPNEQLDPNTGIITAPGDRTAKAPDGYLWEPALYIAPQTAETGGTPYFPQAIKGWYNNNPPANGGRIPNGAGVEVPGMDPVPSGTQLSEKYTTEDIWDVSALGLAPGTYIGEFVIHDGDKDRAVGCVTIVVTAAAM